MKLLWMYVSAGVCESVASEAASSPVSARAAGATRSWQQGGVTASAATLPTITRRSGLPSEPLNARQCWADGLPDFKHTQKHVPQLLAAVPSRPVTCRLVQLSSPARVAGSGWHGVWLRSGRGWAGCRPTTPTLSTRTTTMPCGARATRGCPAAAASHLGGMRAPAAVGWTPPECPTGRAASATRTSRHASASTTCTTM